MSDPDELDAEATGDAPARGSVPPRRDEDTPRSPTPARANRRLALACAAVIAAALAITLARPYDLGLFQVAQSGGCWSQHSERVQVIALWGARGDAPALELLAESDEGSSYPPLLHYVMGAVGSVFGHGEAAVGRAMVLWLLLLAGSAGVCVRRISGSADDAWLTAAATATVPALATLSLIYFFDLPMTALLWLAAAALLLLRPRSPELAGAVAGGIWFLAAFTKWTALPFGVALLGGALLAHLPGERWSRRESLRRVRAGAALTLVSGFLLKAWFSISTSSWRAMSDTTMGDPGAWMPGSVEGGLASLLGSIGSKLQPLSWSRLLAYPTDLVTSVFSPILAFAVLSLLALWLVRDRRGAALVGCTCLGQWAVLFWLVPPVDARFLVTLAPAMTGAAVLGLGHLPAGGRRALIGLWVVLSLWVIYDVQHGSPNALNGGPSARLDQPHSYLPDRGISIKSGDRNTGWVRADTEGEPFAPEREELWTALAACGADVLTVQEGMLADAADWTWWRFRNGLATARGEPSFQQMTELQWFEGLTLPTVAITDGHRPTGEGWERVGSFDDGRIAVWAAPPSACARWIGD